MASEIEYKFAIEVDNVTHFCGGCNNQWDLKKYKGFDESSDKTNGRVLYFAVCLCGNVFYKFYPLEIKNSEI